jgi:hypothetical protein
MSFFSKAEPLLIANVNRIKPLIRNMPELYTLNLSQTLLTDVCCRVCRGKRITYIRNRESGSMQISYCMHCNGSGRMSNRER